ncbi:MAG: amidohydrolase family protein [Victivallales bacterium]|jgi:predicted TIM-barrel fold metal-dependent hydrolase
MYRGKIIDSHFHAYAGEDCGAFIKDMMLKAGLSAIGIASIPNGLAHSEHFYNSEALKLKKEMPDKIYFFGALDYSDKSYREGKVDFSAQARRLFEAGADGMKMLEGKPNARRELGVPLCSDIFDSYYSYMEKNAYPILMHVADPETFWDPDKAPGFAKTHDWFWGDGSYPEKERLYREAEAVLEKFPRLKVTFAHFYFLSADISRASKFLDKWRNVSFDITPGREMYDNFTAKHDEWREFFMNCQDRIIFGTDNTPPLKGTHKEQLDFCVKTVARIREFLETDNEMLSGRGLKLGNKVLEKIYAGNFLKLLRVA